MGVGTSLGGGVSREVGSDRPFCVHYRQSMELSIVPMGCGQELGWGGIRGLELAGELWTGQG